VQTGSLRAQDPAFSIDASGVTRSVGFGAVKTFWPTVGGTFAAFNALVTIQHVSRGTRSAAMSVATSSPTALRGGTLYSLGTTVIRRIPRAFSDTLVSAEMFTARASFTTLSIITGCPTTGGGETSMSNSSAIVYIGFGVDWLNARVFSL